MSIFSTQANYAQVSPFLREQSQKYSQPVKKHAILQAMAI
jgi:hypothetical protein